MDFLAKVAIVSAAMVLSACKTPEVNCTVKIPPQSLGVSAMTTAVTISGSMAATDSTVTLDAASMTIEVSDSTVAFPPKVQQRCA